MDGSGYNFLMRLFHRTALGSKTISEISFDIEKSIFLRKHINRITDGNHLFVSGLSRSGTTALIRCLYETKRFASLTYADMPFVLAPNLWRKLRSGQTNTEYKERAHKDGIFINSESPEAFDEVFWKVFLNDNYIREDRLLINDISSEIIGWFGNYIDLILIKNYQGNKLRYLSKNNNNILRLSPILKNFPNSRVIIPFRNPLQHALSLLNQHHNFCNIHKKNRFALNYMNWIGHHEFGLNHKPFFLDNDVIFGQMLKYDTEDINYWLLNWLNYYTYVLNHYAETCIMFSHERFCEEPDIAMNRLLHQIDLQNFQFELTPFMLKTRICNSFDKQIHSNCMAVYNKLDEMT
ncbi:MAG: sulfotransferase [Bacteroidia bacterium]|nr:sulfotransferase [Bacteroidia bacterium]